MLISGDTYRNIFIQKGPFTLTGSIFFDTGDYNDSDILFGISGFGDEPTISFKAIEGEIRYEEQIVGSYANGEAISFSGIFYHDSGILAINNGFLQVFNTFQYPEYFYILQGSRQCHLDLVVGGNTGDFTLDYNPYFISGADVNFRIRNTGNYFKLFDIDLIQTSGSGFALNDVPTPPTHIIDNTPFKITTSGASLDDTNSDSAFPINLTFHTNYGDVPAAITLRKLYTGERAFEIIDEEGTQGLLFSGDYKTYHIRGLDYSSSGFSDMRVDIDFEYLYGSGTNTSIVTRQVFLTGAQLTGTPASGISGIVVVQFTGNFPVDSPCSLYPFNADMTGEYSGNLVYSGTVTFTGSGNGTGLSISQGKSKQVFSGLGSGKFFYSGTTDSSGLLNISLSGPITGSINSQTYRYPIFADNVPYGYYNSGIILNNESQTAQINARTLVNYNQSFITPFNTYTTGRQSAGTVIGTVSTTSGYRFVKNHTGFLPFSITGSGYLITTGTTQGSGINYFFYTGRKQTDRIVNSQTGAMTFGIGTLVDTRMSSGVSDDIFTCPRNITVGYNGMVQTNHISFSTQTGIFTAINTTNTAGGEFITAPAWRTSGVNTGWIEIASTGIGFPLGFTGMYGFFLKELYLYCTGGSQTGNFPDNVVVSGIYTGDTTWSLLFSRSGGADQATTPLNISGLRNPISGTMINQFIQKTAAGVNLFGPNLPTGDAYFYRNPDLYQNPTESGFCATGNALSRIRININSTLNPAASFAVLNGITLDCIPLLKLTSGLLDTGNLLSTGQDSFVNLSASTSIAADIEGNTIKSGFYTGFFVTGMTGYSGAGSIVNATGLITGCSYTFGVSGRYITGAPLIAYSGSGYYKQFTSFIETGLYSVPCDVLVYTGTRPYLFIPGGNLRRSYPNNNGGLIPSGAYSWDFQGTVINSGAPIDVANSVFSGLNYSFFDANNLPAINYLAQVFALSGSGFYKRRFSNTRSNATITLGSYETGVIIGNPKSISPPIPLGVLTVLTSGSGYSGQQSVLLDNVSGIVGPQLFDIGTLGYFSTGILATMSFDYIHQDFSGLKYRPGVAITGTRIGVDTWLAMASGLTNGVTGNRASGFTEVLSGAFMTDVTGVDEVAMGLSGISAFPAGRGYEFGTNLVSTGIKLLFTDTDGDQFWGTFPVGMYSGFYGKLLVRGAGASNHVPQFLNYSGSQFYKIDRFDSPRIWGLFQGHWERPSGLEMEPTYQYGNIVAGPYLGYESGFVWVAEDTGFFNPLPFPSGQSYLNIQTSGNGPQKIDVLKYPLRVDSGGFVFLRVPIFGRPSGNVTKDIFSPFNSMTPAVTGVTTNTYNGETFISWSDELNIGNANFGNTGVTFDVFSGFITLSGLHTFDHDIGNSFAIYTGNRDYPFYSPIFFANTGVVNLASGGETGSAFIRTSGNNVIKADFNDGVTIAIKYQTCNTDLLAGALSINLTTANATTGYNVFITGTT